MNDSLKIGRVETLPLELDELIIASLGEGFRALQRLRAEWEDGSNRFAGHGEALFEARLGGRLAAVGGLNLDPYVKLETLGRLRHLYVAPEHRRRGVGRALVALILEQARPNFRSVRLRTDRPDADQFYLALGFERTSRSAEATHQLQLTG